MVIKPTLNKKLFHHISKNESLESVKTLLLEGANINTKSVEFGTLLYHACAQGWYNSKVIMWLLENGADPLFVDNQGQTLLMKVIQSYSKSDKLPLIKSLLDAGVDVNAQDRDGERR